MVQAMVRLAKGDMAVEIPGVGRHDEIGEMAGAVDVFKTNMIDAERLRAEQADIEQRQAEQRKADMNRLASEFEAAVGEIVETVSSASTELEASAANADHDRGARTGSCNQRCVCLGGSLHQRAVRGFRDGRADLLGDRDQPAGPILRTHGISGRRPGQDHDGEGQ